MDKDQNRIWNYNRPEFEVSSIRHKTQTSDHVDDADGFQVVDHEGQNDKNRCCIADPFKYIWIHFQILNEGKSKEFSSSELRALRIKY